MACWEGGKPRRSVKGMPPGMVTVAVLFGLCIDLVAVSSAPGDEDVEEDGSELVADDAVGDLADARDHAAALVGARSAAMGDEFLGERRGQPHLPEDPVVDAVLDRVHASSMSRSPTRRYFQPPSQTMPTIWRASCAKRGRSVDDGARRDAREDASAAAGHHDGVAIGDQQLPGRR